jgi:hypothetical protein
MASVTFLRTMTALLPAPFAFWGCHPSVEVGAMATCDDPGVVCDLDGGFSDGALPIDQSEYGEFDRAAYDALRTGIVGDWNGIAVGLESILRLPLEVTFSESSDRGVGTFTLRCPESRFCVPIGVPSHGLWVGQYRVAHVDDGAGGGEFFWDNPDGPRSTVQFAEMRLQQSGQTLSFLVAVDPLDTFRVLMQRGLASDAGQKDAPTPAFDVSHGGQP